MFFGLFFVKNLYHVKAPESTKKQLIVDHFLHKKEADNLPASKQIIIISFLKVFIPVHKQVYSAVIYIILSFFLKHFAYGNGNLSVIAGEDIINEFLLGLFCN